MRYKIITLLLLITLIWVYGMNANELVVMASDPNGLIVTVSEKYGMKRDYEATAVSYNNTDIFITMRNSPSIVLPKCNYAIIDIKHVKN